MPVTKNIVSNYGAVGDGATNDWTAFSNFRTFARGHNDQVTLVMPTHTYVLDPVSANPFPFDGIPLLIIEGNGSTIKVGSGGGSTPFRMTGISGVSQSANLAVLVHSIAIGDTFATCITAAHAARLPMGSCIMISAFELQGDGFPPNHHYLQFVRVTDSNDVTGVVTFDEPARYNYLATYPNNSSRAGYDIGGPAMLSLMTGSLVSTSWDTELIARALTIDNTNGNALAQIYMPGRSVILEDCNFIATAPIPSMNKYLQLLRCSGDTVIEMDKECEYVELKDSDFPQVLVQSSSIMELVYDNVEATDPDPSTASLGTARHTTFRNGCSAGRLRVGVSGYGCSEEVVVEAGGLTALGINSTELRYPDSDWSGVGSALQFENGAVPCPLGPPGSLLFRGMTDFPNGGYPTQVLSVTEGDIVGSNHKMVLHTRFGDPIPSPPAAYGAPFYISQHPCRSVSVAAGNDGCPAMLDLVAAPNGVPLWSYANRTSDFSAAQGIKLWGRIVYYRINVVTPYTGALLTPVTFSGGIIQSIRPDGTTGTTTVTVNTKIAGERIITRTSVTGAQSGDVLAALGNIWLPNAVSPALSDDVSGESAGLRPSINIEILTDQYQRVTLPLRFRG